MNLYKDVQQLSIKDELTGNNEDLKRRIFEHGVPERKLFDIPDFERIPRIINLNNGLHIKFDTLTIQTKNYKCIIGNWIEILEELYRRRLEFESRFSLIDPKELISGVLNPLGTVSIDLEAKLREEIDINPYEDIRRSIGVFLEDVNVMNELFEYIHSEHCAHSENSAELDDSIIDKRTAFQVSIDAYRHIEFNNECIVQMLFDPDISHETSNLNQYFVNKKHKRLSKEILSVGVDNKIPADVVNEIRCFLELLYNDELEDIYEDLFIDNFEDIPEHYFEVMINHINEKFNNVLSDIEGNNLMKLCKELFEEIVDERYDLENEYSTYSTFRMIYDVNDLTIEEHPERYTSMALHIESERKKLMFRFGWGISYEDILYNTFAFRIRYATMNDQIKESFNQAIINNGIDKLYEDLKLDPDSEILRERIHNFFVEIRNATGITHDGLTFIEEFEDHQNYDYDHLTNWISQSTMKQLRSIIDYLKSIGSENLDLEGLLDIYTNIITGVVAFNRRIYGAEILDEYVLSFEKLERGFNSYYLNSMFPSVNDLEEDV